jgi:hypothetical protein
MACPDAVPVHRRGARASAVVTAQGAMLEARPLTTRRHRSWTSTSLWLAGTFREFDLQRLGVDGRVWLRRIADICTDRIRCDYLGFRLLRALKGYSVPISQTRYERCLEFGEEPGFGADVVDDRDFNILPDVRGSTAAG